MDIHALCNIARNRADGTSTDALRQAAKMLDDLLEGLDLPDCHAFQSWCIGEREETRRLRVRLLTALIARLESVPEEALPHARKLALLEPINEAGQATLVRLLRGAGRAREAEEHARRAQRQLADCEVVCTGALRRAARVSLAAGASGHAHDVAPARPVAKRLLVRAGLHEVQFCRTSDDVRIAYAAVGEGPPLVWAAHWLSHLCYSWKSPIWRHWTQEFARDHCFVHYDERGNGLSDWDNLDFSLDAFVRDLEAVVDALELERFALIGSSKGGPTSIAYAARHPERVSHLVLYGTFAHRKLPDGSDLEPREAIIALIRNGWAQDNPAIRQLLGSLFVPDATLEEMAWFNDLQRLSASPENAARLLRAVGDFNVVDLLPNIAVPTLVVHCRDDAAVAFEQGRLIASRIPQARFVALESRNHVLLARDPAWAGLVNEVRRFLGDGRSRPILD